MEGPQWTTGSIGRRCKPGNGLSRPVLIGRHEPHAPTHTHTRTSARARRGGRRTRPPASTTQPRTNPPTPPHTRGAGHQGPRTTTPPPSRRPQRAGKRPDPYRTRKLSPPAPMVLPPPGSGRVGHHRNTHHRPARGRRPHQAPTPTRAKPTPTPYTTQRRLFSGLMVALGPLALRWTTAVRPSFSNAECASRRPGRGGAGRRGPRDRRVTAEHVT